MKCHNCGIPSGTLKDTGQTLRIKVPAENRYRKDREETVWACGEECAVQIYGQAKYGESTRSWPVTLAQVRKEFRKWRKRAESNP